MRIAVLKKQKVSDAILLQGTFLFSAAFFPLSDKNIALEDIVDHLEMSESDVAE